MFIGSSVQVQHMSLTKHNKETHVDTKFRTSSSNDTVTSRIHGTCKYLGNYLNGKHNRHTTWYLSLKEKTVMSSYF